MEIPERNSWQIAENGTLKAGSSPPEQEVPSCKLLILNILRSNMLEQIQNLAPDAPIKIQDHSRRHSSGSVIPLSTSGSKRWISMVMADDENSDLTTNDAEQEMIREPPQIRSPDITLPD
jgi:hypothetical protein